ncbi:hypothetical protein [Pseudomonas syringae group genomosp. 3]|nr:hypothetical protein [Pseudomonas syringae group genomosp. 3]
MNDVLDEARENDILNDDFSLVNPEAQAKINKLQAANDERIQLIEDFDPQNPDDISKKTKLHTDIKQALVDQNGRAADEDDWLERRMKELDLHFNLVKTPAYKSLPLPFIHDVTIHDKHNRELLSWRTGGGNIKIHEAGIYNEAAGQLAAEVAYKKFGHGKVHFNVSKSAKERYKDNMGQICEQKLNQLIKAGFEPEQIVFPKEWQYLVTMKATEMKNLAEFSQATPEQIAEADKAEQDFKAKNQDVEGVKDSPATPVADGEPAKAVPVVSEPASGQAIPNVPTATDGPANAVPASPEAKKTIKIIDHCTLIKTSRNEDPSKEKYNLIGHKGMVESMSDAALRKVAQAFCDDKGIEVSQIAGCWKSDVPVHSYKEFTTLQSERHKGLSVEETKASKDEYSFQAAYDVITDMKEVARLAVASQGVQVPDVASDAVAGVAVAGEPTASVAEPDFDDVPDYARESIPFNETDFGEDVLEDMNVFTNAFDDAVPAQEKPKESIEDVEKFLAEAFGEPQVLKSAAYTELKEARATASEKVKEPKHDDSGIDFSSATSALSQEKEKIDAAKKTVKSAIANETRRPINKKEV